MCRNDRRCRASWDQASRDAENARRRISRNTKKQAAAAAAGEESKAAEYESLIVQAEASLADASARRAQAAAHDMNTPAPEAGTSPEATETEPVNLPVESDAPTEVLDEVAEPTEAPPTVPDEESDAPPSDETTATRAPKARTPKGPKEREERVGAYRYIPDPLDGSPLGQIIKFYSGGYASPKVTATLDEYGIVHRVDDDGLAIPADSWSPEVHDALSEAGIDDLPPRDADRGFLDWLFAPSEDAA